LYGFSSFGSLYSNLFALDEKTLIINLTFQPAGER
jgi:hypothetical protein